MLKLFSIVVLCTTFNLVAADAKPKPWQVTSKATIAIAKNYHQYLLNNQVDKAMELVADDVVFTDYTWGSDETKGREKLRAIYSGSSSTIHNFSSIERFVMTSRGTVVIVSTISGDMDLLENAKAEQRFHGLSDMIRVITIKDGKIVRHIDLLNYDDFIPQFAKAREQL